MFDYIIDQALRVGINDQDFPLCSVSVCGPERYWTVVTNIVPGNMPEGVKYHWILSAITRQVPTVYAPSRCASMIDTMIGSRVNVQGLLGGTHRRFPGMELATVTVGVRAALTRILDRAPRDRSGM